MKKSEMFREAKKHLWDGIVDYNTALDQEQYICFCLVAEYGLPSGYDLHSDTFYACTDMVREAIMGYRTLEEYLAKEEGREHGSYTREYVQSRRLALLERLILEAEAEENKEESQ